MLKLRYRVSYTTPGAVFVFCYINVGEELFCGYAYHSHQRDGESNIERMKELARLDALNEMSQELEKKNEL